MHPNPAFRKETRDQNLAFARERGFGVLSVNGSAAPMLAHVPYILDQYGSEARLHLVRSNPIARSVKSETPAVIAVNGPDGYVSPDWYGTEDQVPTWNYVAVHLIGTLTPMPPEALRDQLDDVSTLFEEALAPKKPWTADKMTPDVMNKMMRQILPYRLTLTDVQGTWKLNQNKPDDVRRRAAEHMAAFGLGGDAKMLAALMLGADPE